MGRRKPRYRFNEADAEALLGRLREMRKELIDAGERTPFGHPVRGALDTVKDAIDGVAEVVTGNRQHFWCNFASQTFASKDGPGRGGTCPK